MMCNQGISFHFGFIVQSSSDSDCIKHLQGLRGETCHCLIVDHFSGTLYGETFNSKAPPIAFLNRWLAQHGLPADVPDKYVCFDLGGKLGHSPDVCELFQKAGYAIEPTAPNSSHQNGPGERPHQIIGDAICAMLGRAAFPPKFWPYAFHHFLCIYNVTVHCDKQHSRCVPVSNPIFAIFASLGVEFMLCLRTCAVLPRLSLMHVLGYFLGFSKTMKNCVLFYDTVSKTVRMAQHVTFD
jgi:hypothetical protein